MAAFLFKHRQNRITHITERLYHTELGCTLMSALFGVALAFMFQRVCKGSQCTIFKAPPKEDIEDVIYEIQGNGCYMYIPRIVDCQ